MSRVGLGRPGNNDGAGGLVCRPVGAAGSASARDAAGAEDFVPQGFQTGILRGEPRPKGIFLPALLFQEQPPRIAQALVSRHPAQQPTIGPVQAVRLAESPEEPPRTAVSAPLPPQAHQPRYGPHARHQRGHNQQSQQHVVMARRPPAAKALAEALAAAVLGKHDIRDYVHGLGCRLIAGGLGWHLADCSGPPGEQLRSCRSRPRSKPPRCPD